MAPRQGQLTSAFERSDSGTVRPIRECHPRQRNCGIFAAAVLFTVCGSVNEAAAQFDPVGVWMVEESLPPETEGLSKIPLLGMLTYFVTLHKKSFWHIEPSDIGYTISIPIRNIHFSDVTLTGKLLLGRTDTASGQPITLEVELSETEFRGQIRQPGKLIYVTGRRPPELSAALNQGQQLKWELRALSMRLEETLDLVEAQSRRENHILSDQDRLEQKLALEQSARAAAEQRVTALSERLKDELETIERRRAELERSLEIEQRARAVAEQRAMEAAELVADAARDPQGDVAKAVAVSCKAYPVPIHQACMQFETRKQRVIKKLSAYAQTLADRERTLEARAETHLPSATLTASRSFAGPNQYPPEEFAAYGILAFRSRASSHNHSRHLMICEAYVASLVHWSELTIALNVALNEQMVTVWPVDSDPDADTLNRAPRDSRLLCEFAISNYGLVVAQQALTDAELSGVDVTDNGPFLLAWSPSTNKGKKDTLVLVSNLSDVTTYDQTRDMVQEWVLDIQQNPELWRGADGWNVEMVRAKIRLWVDKYGPKALALFGGKR